MKAIILVFIIIVSTSLYITCGKTEKTKKTSSDVTIENEPYNLHDSMYVELDYNLYNASFADSARHLSDGEMLLADVIVFEQLKNEAPNIYKKRQLYKRQYFCGFKDGQIIIYINYFIDKTGQLVDWKSNYIVVDDGGDNYFQIKLNWTEMKCYDLSINGDA